MHHPNIHLRNHANSIGAINSTGYFNGTWLPPSPAAWLYVDVLIVMLVFVTIFVALRLWIRLSRGAKKLFIDDYLLLLGVLFYYGVQACQLANILLALVLWETIKYPDWHNVVYYKVRKRIHNIP